MGTSDDEQRRNTPQIGGFMTEIKPVGALARIVYRRLGRGGGVVINRRHGDRGRALPHGQLAARALFSQSYS